MAPAALAGAAAAIVIGLLSTIIVLLHADHGADASPALIPATTSEQPSQPATTAAPTHPKRHHAPTAPDPGPGDVRDLPAGLFCRDLNSDTYSYSAAVDYWRLHGQPNQMDSDRNGIPCETVYPVSDVEAYWGQTDTDTDTDGYTLPAGLFCRDLYARGYSYSSAMDYWTSYGEPDQMDADLNGVPCETVYPASDVSAYWGFDPGPVVGQFTAGLYCRDLYAMGVSYPDAVTYWWDNGSPDRMDIDLNGIPCETVYPVSAVDAFWY